MAKVKDVEEETRGSFVLLSLMTLLSKIVIWGWLLESTYK